MSQSRGVMKYLDRGPKYGSGCSTAVEGMPRDPEVMGSNPGQVLGFFK